MHPQGKREKGKGGKGKKGKGGKEKGREGEKGKGGDAKFCNFVGPAIYSCIFLGEKACRNTTLSCQKFKTNNTIVYKPSSFKNLRSRRSDGEREELLSAFL